HRLDERKRVRDKACQMLTFLVWIKVNRIADHVISPKLLQEYDSLSLLPHAYVLLSLDLTKINRELKDECILGHHIVFVRYTGFLQDRNDGSVLTNTNPTNVTRIWRKVHSSRNTGQQTNCTRRLHSCHANRVNDPGLAVPLLI